MQRPSRGKDRDPSFGGVCLRTGYTLLGRTLALSAVLLFAWAYLFGHLLVAAAGAAVLLFLVYRRLHFNSALARFGMTVEREVLERIVHKDSPFSVRVEVRSGHPFQVSVVDKVPLHFALREGDVRGEGRVGPGKAVSFLYSLVPTDRGMYPLSPLEVRIVDTRGLFHSTVLSDPGTTVQVQASKRELVMASLMGRRKRFDITGKADRRRTRTFRSDFKGIREYMAGDRFRDIDWKASSRMTRLMTREFEMERNIPTMVMVDCSMSMRELTGKHTKIDHAIALAIQAASVLSAQGNPVGLIAYDEHRVLVHLRPVRSELDDVLMALFRLPNPAQTGGYPGYVWEKAAGTTPDESLFMGAVGPFLVSGKRQVYDQRRTTGIHEAVRTIAMEEESGMLIVLLTDIETSRDSLVSSLSEAMRLNHRVVLISTFSWPYHARTGELDRSTLELMYRDHQKKQDALRNLRAAGIRVIDVTPKERGDSVMGRLRRMSQ